MLWSREFEARATFCVWKDDSAGVGSWAGGEEKQKESSETGNCGHLGRRSLPPPNGGSENGEKEMDMNKPAKGDAAGPDGRLDMGVDGRWKTKMTAEF